MKQHKTYKAYFNDIMKIYGISCFTTNTSEKMGGEFRNIFMDLLMEKVKSNWHEYKSQTRETYHLSDVEFDSVFKEAEYQMTFKSITKLSNLGFLQASIKSDGEIVYSLTEEGHKLAESIDRYL